AVLPWVGTGRVLSTLHLHIPFLSFKNLHFKPFVYDVFYKTGFFCMVCRERLSVAKNNFQVTKKKFSVSKYYCTVTKMQNPSSKYFCQGTFGNYTYTKDNC
ncbi:MAG: hypothetical protein ABIN48_03620, partial [Ginsengibacter sp.]